MAVGFVTPAFETRLLRCVDRAGGLIVAFKLAAFDLLDPPVVGEILDEYASLGVRVE